MGGVLYDLEREIAERRRVGTVLWWSRIKNFDGDGVFLDELLPRGEELGFLIERERKLTGG